MCKAYRVDVQTKAALVAAAKGVQGIEADSDTRGNVQNLIPGEGFVLIKSETVVGSNARTC